jgi:predicted transcriptional regulator
MLNRSSEHVQGLRTVIYAVADREKAKAWYSRRVEDWYGQVRERIKQTVTA